MLSSFIVSHFKQKSQKHLGAALLLIVNLMALENQVVLAKTTEQRLDPVSFQEKQPSENSKKIAPTQFATNLPAQRSEEAGQTGSPTDSLRGEPGLEPMIELAPKLNNPEEDAPKTSLPANNAESNTLSTTEPLKARAVLVDINSNTLNYDKERDVYVATGSAHVVISEQNSELTADKVTYDEKTGMMIAEGHVVIIKKGQKTEGTYAKIDLTRQSALINDAVTDIKAIRIKAKKSFVTSKYIELENGKFIISGQGMMQIQRTGGLSNIAQATGKGSSQARLNREYNKKIFDNRMLFSPNALTLIQTQALKAAEGQFNFDDNKASISSLQLKVKEIDINRNEGGYDKIDLKFPSLYAGKYKLGGIADNQFSYDEVNKQYQYLGPDTGVNYNLGGAYWGPGWDFQVGKNGSFRFSPIVSIGTAGFQSTNGKDGKDKGFGPGIGGIVHYRDPNTTADLSYSSRAGTAVFFGDRKITENTHLMGSYNDFYQNGLLGQLERPNYIAQVTDYRILKQFNNFMLTSFESAGVARDNFFPTFKNSYFVNANTPDPQTAGRLQLQAQIANIRPLLKIGNHVNFGLRGQLIGHAYTTGDFYGIARVGPTLNVNFTKFSSQIGYFQSMVTGQSPFVFDSYFGGAQNLSLNNSFVVNKYLMVGMSQSLNLNRDNARNALAVANQLYFMVGPPDVKMQIGFDFVNKRSQFSVNYYPGSKNTVVNFDKLKMYQPNSFSGKTSNIPANIPVNNLNNMIIPPTSSSSSGSDSTP